MATLIRAVEILPPGKWPGANAADHIVLTYDERHRRRLRYVATGGTTFLLDLPRAAVLRTLPNGADKARRDYTGSTPPYLSREAAEFLVARGIEHLVVDLPSIDRSHDEGRLTAHRVFFGLPRGASSLALAERARATVTELAYIPNEVADGPYLLQIQVPAIGGDAVPSRPLLYMFEQ